MRRGIQTDLLLIWFGFISIFTWLDWVGLLAYFFASFPIIFSRFVLLGISITLLTGVYAILRREQITLLLRIVLASSMAWLLVLPMIAWSSEKALIIEYAVLVPGMPRTVVHSIMTTYPGIHDPGYRGEVFCVEEEWQQKGCSIGGTYVIAHMSGDVLVSAEIELD